MYTNILYIFFEYITEINNSEKFIYMCKNETVI